MSKEFDDALLEMAQAHNHPLWVVNCDAEHACPACRMTGEPQTRCPPRTCGTQDGIWLHIGKLGCPESKTLLNLLARLQKHDQAPATPDIGTSTAGALSSPVRPRGGSPARLF